MTELAEATPGRWTELENGLERALGPVRQAPGPLVVLFSGGVDSGLLAWELRQRPGTELFSVGLAGSTDLKAARSAAHLLGLPWAGRELDDDSLETVNRAIGPELEGVPGPRRGIFVALACAVAYAPTGTLVCGQGADELFLGYAHFRGLSAELALRRSEQDLDLQLREDLPRSVAIARRWQRQLCAPFLAPEFVRAAQRFAIAERLPTAVTKSVFRQFARHRGLPAALADAPKRAIQYGSGVDRWLRRRAGQGPA
jgi:asparagine synthase (glutamine-hydrolysing)